LVTDSHIILVGKGSDFFSQLLHVHGVDDVRQTKIHTAEPLVPEPSAFEIKMAIEYLVRPKSQGTDQIPAELITGGKNRSEIHKLINSIRNKEELPEEWKESIMVPMYRVS